MTSPSSVDICSCGHISTFHPPVPSIDGGMPCPCSVEWCGCRRFVSMPYKAWKATA